MAGKRLLVENRRRVERFHPSAPRAKSPVGAAKPKALSKRSLTPRASPLQARKERAPNLAAYA